jgi:peptidoglycan/LPS O-acetylase OafA/YrhL
MPKPTEPGRHYVAGLDGIRALAVLCVIAYHLGFGWAAGGMLGVGVFFTLSGYLITDLLLGHWRRHGELELRTFWIRRARRLLPALVAMLIVVSIVVAVFDSGELASVRRQVISAAFYFANWSTIAQHGSYFARFAPPLPLDHLWSLSIEEQFYLVWPAVLMVAILLTRGRLRLALLTLTMAGVSVWAMADLYHPGYDPTRVYEGTDTRAFGLLIGAALAAVWPTRRGRGERRFRKSNALEVLGLVGLVAIFVLVWRTTPFSHFLYPWGFVLLSVGTAAVIAAVVNPASSLGAVLAAPPLRWIGVRSYGIYLWQWPMIVLVNPVTRDWGAARPLVEVAGTLLIAALSWRFIEEPIRRRGLLQLGRRMMFSARRRRIGARALALVGPAVATGALAVVGLTGLLPAASSSLASSGTSRPLLKTIPSSTTAYALPGHARASGKTATAPALPASLASNAPTHTSCHSVVYIGDSTSEGEVSPTYIPNPGQRLGSQLTRVGVHTLYPEISGARSIVETYKGFANGATVAQGHLSAGFKGCWILALGTNDVADVKVGGTPGFAGRIDRMMSIIRHQPVMWVETVTLLASGSPYEEPGMQAWNRDLLAACARYPNMRVFDWPAHAHQSWFIPDGIHYYSPGYEARARFISRGLAHGFPAGRPTRPPTEGPGGGVPSPCLVH